MKKSNRVGNFGHRPVAKDDPRFPKGTPLRQYKVLLAFPCGHPVLPYIDKVAIAGYNPGDQVIYACDACSVQFEVNYTYDSLNDFLSATLSAVK